MRSPGARRRRGAGPQKLLGITLVAAACLSLEARSDPLQLGVSASERYDSNLFALPDGVQPGGEGPRTDTTQSAGVSLHLATDYGLQRFFVDASLYRNQYNHYGNLDTNGRVLTATWNWHLTPEFSGNLIVNRSAIPGNFADIGYQTEPSVRRAQLTRLDIDFRPGAALHPRFSIFQYEDKSDRPVFQIESSKATSIESSLIYEFRSTNTAELYARSGRGNYFDILSPLPDESTHFDEHEFGVRSAWGKGERSTLSVRLGDVSRKHNNLPIRNFDGVVGTLAYTYAVTGKTQLQFNLARTLTSAQTTFSNYSRDDSVSFTPTWIATGKISVRPFYSIIRRSFLGSVGPGSFRLDETSRNAGLAVDWAALNSLDATLYLVRANRISNDPSLQFLNGIASVQIRVKF